MSTLCTSGSVKLKAGTNATVLTTSEYDEFIQQAEGAIIADTGVNWVDNYSGLNADFKQLLEGATAAKAAVSVIGYDPLALGNLNTAATKVNICLDEYDRAVSKLKEIDIITKFGASKIE